MIYKVVYSEKALKQISKLDKNTVRIIINYMDNVSNLQEPRSKGKALSGNLRGFWRYRVGKYRILTQVEDDKLTVFVVDVGHRSEIYQKDNI